MVVVYAFAGWTVFVWSTRVRNIVEDGGSGLNLAAAVGLTALGAAVGLTAWRRRDLLAATVVAAVGATGLAWAIRVPQIVFEADHGAAFKVVHVALAAVSVTLAGLAWRTTAYWPVAGSRSRHPSPTPSRAR